MKNKILLIAVLTIITTAVLYFVTSKKNMELVGSSLIQPTPTTSMATPNAPKTFNFDSTTDLKQELEKINPQILDHDFE